MKHVILLDLTSDGVPSWDMQAKTTDYQKYVKNPSKRDKDLGYYHPRLTVYKRRFGQEDSLRIEFSVPKILYNNNLDELSDQDFDKVIDTLKGCLFRMGVAVEAKYLVDASVSTAHFSKNIELTSGITAQYAIAEIGKVNLRQAFDFARARYINDGESICAHTTSHELVIYDKIADLRKGKKRAVDKDQTLYQSTLFDRLKAEEELREILRIEIRLIKKVKMNSILKQLGYAQNPTFKDVFNSKMSRDVVTLYWQSIIKNASANIFLIEQNYKTILSHVYKQYPKIKPSKAIYLVGLYMLSRDGNGLRELRRYVTQQAEQRTWYRIYGELKSLSEGLSKQYTRDWVTQIDQTLKLYTPLKSRDYEKQP